MTQYPPPGATPDPSSPSAGLPDAPGAPPPGPQPGPAWGPGPWGPGSAPPPYGSPYGQAAYGQAPHPGPPVHQPGVVPLRPLTLGDLYGGAIATIRRAPGATMGLAALVSVTVMIVPIAGTLAAAALGGLPSLDLLGGSEPSFGTVNGTTLVANAVAGVFSFLSSTIVTGVMMRTVEQSVIGRRLTPRQAWAAARGSILRLLGLGLLVGLAAIVVLGVPVGAAVAVGVALHSTPVLVLLVLGAVAGAGVVLAFLYTRFVILAAPNLVLEGHGILASLRRAGQLSTGQFWRLFGITLLTGLVTGLATQVIAIPLAVVGVFATFALSGSSGAIVSLLVTNYVTTMVTGALIGPFSGGVVALQYFDQRFRKEGHDIELLDRALGRVGS